MLDGLAVADVGAGAAVGPQAGEARVAAQQAVDEGRQSRVLGMGGRCHAQVGDEVLLLDLVALP